MSFGRILELTAVPRCVHRPLTACQALAISRSRNVGMQLNVRTYRAMVKRGAATEPYREAFAPVTLPLATNETMGSAGGAWKAGMSLQMT